MKNRVYKTRVTRFINTENGAITVDWIVLTATLVALGMAAVFYATSSVPDVADNTADYMKNYQVSQ